MRYRGVHYDVGTRFVPARLTRPELDADLVRYEMATIAESLHCNAVRIVGENPVRLALAAEAAIDRGLTVFMNPWLIDHAEAELVEYVTETARIAEDLRSSGADVWFVVGCEMTLFSSGLIPGDSVYERVDWLADALGGVQPNPLMTSVGQGLDHLLRAVSAAARLTFRGPVTYASGRWEEVDWTMFDAVGVDYYRSGQSREEYVDGLRDLARHAKPVFVLEFGCCTYEGADELGGLGWRALDEWHDGGPIWTSGKPPVRSESTQARYVEEQIGIFAVEPVDGAFVFTFVAPYLTHDSNPHRDFDMASYALVKTLPPQGPGSRELPPWQPKASFRALAIHNRSCLLGEHTTEPGRVVDG